MLWQNLEDPRVSEIDLLTIKWVKINRRKNLRSSPVTEWLKECVNLVEIELTSDRMIDSDSEFLSQSLQHLTKLSLGGNFLTSIGGFILNAPSLIKLYLSGNKIESIEGVSKLTCLVELDLSSNKIKDIEEVCELTNLETLTLYDNSVVKLPDLSKLKNLVELNLSENKIEKIGEISGLKKLETLDLSENRICEIECIANLPKLSTLDLSDNRINKIEGITNLPKLRTLDLSSNSIRKIEGLSEMKRLETLILDSNKITDIEGLDEVKWLTCLSLSKNRITNISGGRLSNLQLLETLDLSDNQIVDVGGLLRSPLMGLFDLDLSNNNISHLPNLTTISPEIQTIETSGNPIKTCCPEIELFFAKYYNNNYERKNIYSYHENVLSGCVKFSTKNNILTLLSTDTSHPFSDFTGVAESVRSDPLLPESTKKDLIEYSGDTENSLEVLFREEERSVNFAEVLRLVWNRISGADPELSAEVKNVLSAEMEDASGSCFSGKISRLINCLVGFFPDISVEIDKNEQLSNIVHLTEKKLSKTQEHYTREDHVRLVTAEMAERGYNIQEIEVWTSAIE